MVINYNIIHTDTFTLLFKIKDKYRYSKGVDDSFRGGLRKSVNTQNLSVKTRDEIIICDVSM